MMKTGKQIRFNNQRQTNASLQEEIEQLKNDLYTYNLVII